MNGEKAVIASNADAMIVRTSWVYHESGYNFVRTMMRLMQERDLITVVADQHCNSTYAGDLAAALLEILHQKSWKGGIYHYSNIGATTWYDFAVAINEISGFNCRVEPISTDQYPTPANRPKYSLLNTSKFTGVFNIHIPYWRTSLENVITKIK